jgi:negative regulator of flagellin synthesis FlgM
MVESIKNTISRMELRKSNNPHAEPQTANKSAATTSSIDSVELKSAENMSAIREMAASAPIDRANVDRIKDAIKRGEYPIDIDRISDALLEAYKEMKSS